MSTYMLFNMPPWSGWKFLHDTENEISKIEFIYQEKHLMSMKELVRACNECIKKSKRNDTIVCAYDLMGVLCDMIPSSRTQKYKNLLGGILCPEKVKLMQ